MKPQKTTDVCLLTHELLKAKLLKPNFCGSRLCTLRSCLKKTIYITNYPKPIDFLEKQYIVYQPKIASVFSFHHIALKAAVNFGALLCILYS